MKHMKSIFHKLIAAVAFLGVLGLGGCVESEFEEIKSLNLSRCLEPVGLNARVNNTLGDVVTFSWDVAKDADSYILTVYTDKGLTQKYLQETVKPSGVPVQKKLDADQTYYFTVQATAEGKQDSKVAAFDKSVSTFAVKDNLFLKVTGRTTSSVSLAWSTEAADASEVDRIEYGTPDTDSPSSHALASGEIAAGSATIDGLSPSVNYEFKLFFKSALRGQVNAWTTPDVTGYTRISSLDALLNAVKTPGAKILLSMDGSPYEVGTLDISNGFCIMGEETADGTKPVIQGEFQFADNWTSGNDLYFEGVEFNGGPTATAPSGFGFAIQNKNGGTVDGKNIGNITYKNCVITNYTKGLMYEWGKAMVLGDVTYLSSEIGNINADGTVGGDVFDIRQATTIGKLSFVDNTIYQGMRTFIRIDAGTMEALVVENNTLYNLNFVDNANNAGFFGLQIAPGSVSLKNNLFIGMVEKATLGSENAKYKTADDLGVSASNNWFYNVVDSYFTASWPSSKAGYNALAEDPCYNAAGGLFNLTSSTEISGQNVGASKWWTPFVEEPEDLTLGTVEGSHTWNLSNAKYFSGTIKKEMVRDLLYINGGESNPVVAADGMLNFKAAAVTDRRHVPSAGYLAFKVPGPGSLLIKASDPDGVGNHLVVGVGPVEGGSIALKGGVSAMSDMDNAQKIVISSIAGESLVYIYPTGPVSLEKLAWSTEMTPVNTALPTPVAKADPKSISAGEAADITVSWDPVEGADGYSVVFNGKSYNVPEGTEYVIGGTTTGMLDAGAYKVEVYANPGVSDIYNTESAAGVAAFAVLPKGGGEGDAELVVSDIDGLLAAINAGKEAITLAPGEYDLGGALTVTAPLALKGQEGAVVKGGFKLSGDVGSFSVENLTFQAGGHDIFLNLDNAGSGAEMVKVSNSVIDGFSKSVIYASNTADVFNFGDIVFDGVEVYNHGAGQGMFDLRNGSYSSFTLVNSTCVGGRDFLRIDAPCSIYAVNVKNNTLDNLNDSGNAGGVFCVRATPSVYEVSSNIVANIANSISGRTSAMKPKMKNNVWYNIGEKFYTGCIDEALAASGGGVVLSADPFKAEAENDFTLTNAVVMSLGAGAPKWNPAVAPASDGKSFTVSSVEEFQAAVDAGKTDIKFAAGSYDLSAAAINLTAGMRLSGEDGAEVTVSQFNLAEGELGDIVIENISFTGSGSNNFINVGSASIVNNLTVRNCRIDGVGKSIIYGNGEGSTFSAAVFSGNVITGLGGGQGTFDIRKGTYSVLTIDNNTIAGGRDFIRADKGTVTGAVNIVNNTFDGVTLSNNNGVLYVRATPDSYVVKNNLFLNENGDNNKLSKDSGITVPTSMTGNYFYNCVAEAFWTGLINQEVALSGGGVILPSDPVKDAAGKDYTLVDALCMSSNVGAARWNLNAGKVSPEITVASVTELTTAIEAGKGAITLKGGQYDLREASEGGVITLTAPLALYAGGNVEVIGGFKFGAGTTSFVAENIKFNGVEKAMGNTFEIAEAVEMSRIRISGCEIYGYNKSLFYGNGADSHIEVFDFQGNIVKEFGTGQGMIDIRKGTYSAVNVSRNTFFNGGRDFIRCDKDIAGSIAITNNTFGLCSIDAGNGLLWVRSCADAPERYNVARNLFLNLTGEKTILAKSGATVPTMDANYFFNVGGAFFSGAIDQAAATTGGGMLEADPCGNSAEFDFVLNDAALRAADIGDPRWNSSSPNYSRKRK